MHDQGGVSGTGHLLDGIQFSNGKVAVAWLGKGELKVGSVSVFDNIEDFIAIHINSHPGNETKLIWEDDPDFPA